MPITFGGSARRRVVARGAGAGAAAGSAHGSIARAGVVEGDAGAGAAGSADGSTARGRVVEGDAGAGAAGSAHGSIVVAGRLGCAALVDGAFGAAGRGGVAFTRGAWAAGLLESKGGGSVDFLTWSDDEVESAGSTVFAGGEVGPLVCA